MGSVYRRERRKGGKVVKDRKYTISFRGADGKTHTAPGFTDRKASVEKMRQLEIAEERASVGLPVEPGAAARHSFADAVDAFCADLDRQGCTAKHVGRRRQQLTAAAKHCSWTSVRQLSQAGATAFLTHLSQRPSSPTTCNHYLTSLIALGGFCVRQGWLPTNPLTGLPRASVGAPGDISRRPHARRALNPAELAALLTCPAIRLTRRQLYRVAAMSGLRANELRQLAPCDFTLGARPRWHPRPEIVKGRRLDTVPMLPECADLLTSMTASLGVNDRIFPRRVSSVSWHADLRRAGIRRFDDRGRRANFHSLRMTFCTTLARVLPIQTVQRLMRHKSITMTTAIYLDLGIADLAEQMDALPRLFEAKPGIEKAG